MVETVKNVVLVHGGFVDGSGWEGVYGILKKDGYTVTHRPESDDLAGRRCGRDEARDRRAEGTRRCSLATPTAVP